MPVVIVPDDDLAVVDAAELEAEAQSEAERELDMLTENDWLYVAAVVQVGAAPEVILLNSALSYVAQEIARERAEQQQEQAMEELELAVAEQAIEDEAERDAEQEPVIVLQGEPALSQVRAYNCFMIPVMLYAA